MVESGIKTMNYKCIAIIMYIALVLAFSAFLGVVVQQIWNFFLVGNINGVDRISMWQGWGIVALVQLIFAEVGSVKQ